MYIKTKYIFKNDIEVHEYHNGRYGAPGMGRLKKKKITPEQVKKQNQINRENRIRRKIKANYGEYDYLFTYTYKKENRPFTLEPYTTRVDLKN